MSPQGYGFDALLRELTVSPDRHLGPILVLGLLPVAEVKQRVTAVGGRQAVLFRWPGFAYLSYGCNKDELLETVRRVVEGAKTPLSPGLLPAVNDVLRLTSEVRHWLENRRRNVESARRNFERAARGEITLDESYLEPVVAVSDEHRAMLERLWGLEGPATRFAPKVGGLSEVKESVAHFEAHWLVLERGRADLREAAADERFFTLADLAQAQRLVADALTAAITATQELDDEMISQAQEH